MHFWGVTLNDSRGGTLNAFRGSELVNFYNDYDKTEMECDCCLMKINPNLSFGRRSE